MKSVEEKIRENLKMIESMVEQGSTDKEIAEKIDVGYSTFKSYKAKNKDLKELMAECKDKKNEQVEQSLFKICNGYKYYEEVATKVKNEALAEDGKTILVKEDVVVKSIKKYKGPDLAAQKYWLNNMKKTKWSEDPNKVLNDKKLTKLKEKEVNSKVIEI
ncbi:Xaa-His dipeptidase [Clostridium sp. YIM B02500]|uniref:Xaa-His dipeptidase n=1 Tax=Clostridium sp. YIM B02500 TaxID=2910681 RepID=UPI001EEDAC4E|nr:Xaa-His dipeptidase [Clostridium sp. YIM B02500]